MTNAEVLQCVDDGLSKLRITPHTTMEQIAQICAAFTTPLVEVHARVEFVSGKPVAYFVRTPTQETLPAFLRRQAS